MAVERLTELPPQLPAGTGPPLFEHLLALAREAHPTVQSGVFGADMRAVRVNDGLVTVWLNVA